MSERVVVRTAETGDLVAVKTAPPTETDRLRHEAEVLRGLDHPGVVRLVELRVTDVGPELVTRWAGGRSLLGGDRPWPLDRAVAMVLAVASLVDALHRAGVVHGRIDASHVLLDPRGRPVLCGFAEAGPLGERRAAEDVAGLGALLLDLLAAEPDVRRRVGRWRDHRRRREVVALCHRACTEQATARPALAGFRDALRQLVPEARLTPDAAADPRPAAPDATADAPPLPRPTGGLSWSPDLVDPASEPTVDELLAGLRSHRPAARHGRRPEPRSRLALLVAVGAVGLATFFGVSAWTGDGDARTVAAASAEQEQAPSTGTTTPATAPSPTPATVSAPPPTAPGADPPAVEIDGRRYTLGQPGDLALVGPWRCDGAPTAAVLRPATGSLFVVDAWPDQGPAEARPVGAVDGAVALGARPGVTPDCPALVVTLADGRTLPVAPEDLR